MADQQTDRRAVRAQQRDAARTQGAHDVTEQQLQVDRALGAIRSDQFWTDILAALPRTLDSSWFRQVATTAIMSDPRLLGAERKSLAISLMFAARMGLMPGAGFGEIALFTDGTGRVQHRVMYGGVLKLVRNSRLVKVVDAQPVYANDPCELLVGERPKHRIPLTDRGPLIGAYAYAVLESGEAMIEYADWASIWKHAQRYSDALKRGHDTPWKDPEAQPEMAAKTVLLRLTKTLPKSPEVALALAHEYEAERGERARDVTPTQQQLEAPRASAPRGWSQQFAAAGGNGHEAPEPLQAPPEEAPDVPRPPPPTKPPMPPGEPPAQTAEPSKRSPGRPKKPETVARDIIAELGATHPETVSWLMAHHEEAIAGLPDHLRTEVVTAAQDRMASDGEDADIESAGPEADAEFETWRVGMEAAMSHCQLEFLIADKLRWMESGKEFGERAATAVQAAFDARQG